MTTVLIVIGIVLVVALVLFLAKRIGGRRQVKRLKGTSQERRQRAREHNIRVAQLEQELERERVQADQLTSAAREAEAKLATKGKRTRERGARRRNQFRPAAAGDLVALEAFAEPFGGDLGAALAPGRQPALGAGGGGRSSRRACATEPSGSGSSTARASLTVISPSDVTVTSLVLRAAVRVRGWA
jgi:hypothetical protein